MLKNALNRRRDVHLSSSFWSVEYDRFLYSNSLSYTQLICTLQFLALFPLAPNNLQLHCFLGLRTLLCFSFFCPLDQPCKTGQTAPPPLPLHGTKGLNICTIIHSHSFDPFCNMSSTLLHSCRVPPIKPFCLCFSFFSDGYRR